MKWAIVSLMVLLAPVAASRAAPRLLRACADPNNLPFSDRAERGFENQLARLLAEQLGAELRYTWWPQRRGFVRNTLGAGRCDVLLGVPTGFARAATTRPYYRSSYVFVSRRDRALSLGSLDDPRLKTLRIGVPLVGDDGANPPPAEALARRGVIDNVIGFPVHGDSRDDSPPARLVKSVARGELDAAVAWGPLAGYFAKHSDVPLALSRVRPERDGPLPFTFAISLGVRRDDHALRHALDGVLAANRTRIRALLDAYGVPQLD